VAEGPPAYSGHSALIGVFGGNPDTVPDFYAHQAINRFFREDQNRTRPSIRSVEIEFESEEDRIWFAGGNGQGAFFYNRYPSFLEPEIIVSIAGKIFAITVSGRTATARVIFECNSSLFMHSWMAQGFEWLFIQDGINNPIFYNGDTARRSDTTIGEMPIGSVMAFIHGRMAVASADGKNSIFVGDIVYGSNQTNTEDLLNFTEQTYWAEGGSFDAPVNIGDINGLYPMPYLDTGTGQNELVVLGAAGFTSLDLSGPRETWIDTSVQRVSMIGQGAVSSHGFSGLNGDVFYRRADGIGSYRNARVEYSQRWSNTPISRAVDHWLRYDRNDLLQFIPMTSWQNMIFCGVSPLLARPNNPCAGYHRYCRGFVAFDSQSMSTASRDGTPVWHGMWTGIRPWAMVQGRINTADRCFMLSYDRDGKNRLYEMTLEDGNDFFEGTPRKIYSRYDTGSMGSVEGRTSLFGLKKMTGGVLELNNIRGASTFSVAYRPDGAPCWVPVTEGAPGCDCPNYVCPSANSKPAFARKYFEGVSDQECVPGTVQAGNAFHHFQGRVTMEGSMTVERMNFRFDIEKASEVAECLGNDCTPIDCCPDEDDYAYHIAPSGENNEVPAVPCPPDVAPFFTSTRTRLLCNSFGQCVVGRGQGTSSVSQADADQQAEANALADAQAQLGDEPSCGPSVETSFTIDGGTEDLSAFMAAGVYSNNIDQPARLQDIIVGETIAYGVVTDAGTMVLDTTYPQYTHGAYDPGTSVYTDIGGGSTVIELQLGCSDQNGVITFPESTPY